MKRLKSYQLFENLETAEWTDIKDLINVVEDELNFEFEQLKVTDDSSVGGDKIISFIFTGREWVAPLYKKDEDIYKWFIQQIVGIGQFITNGNGGEVIKLRKDFGVFHGSNRNRFATVKFQDLTYVEVLKISDRYEYHFNFKANVFTILDWVIRNPQDKDLLKNANRVVVIFSLFQFFCKRSFHDIDFSILSVLSNTKDNLLWPVKKRDVQLPYNLSDQFIIDVTPIFLEKVFRASGLIFRLRISRYDERSVTNPDRLRGHSIAHETDQKLKELGLDMTWKDIFIIEN